MGDIDLKKTYAFLKGGVLSSLIIQQNPYGSQSHWLRPAVIVVPGGSYGMVSPREGEIAAAKFLAQGFQTFVLSYLIANDGVSYPEQRNELGASIDYLKKHAEEYHINPKEIFSVGFSAGGHLVADVAMEEEDLKKELGLDAKLKGIGLGYPVISHEEGEASTYANLLQGYSDEEKSILWEKLSMEKHVKGSNPPAYVFSTGNDELVPVSNAIRYASALYKQGVRCELHIFSSGGHGLSTGDKESCVTPNYDNLDKSARSWCEECSSFFRDLVEEPF